MKRDKLGKIPVISEKLSFRQDKKRLVTIDIENKGFFSKIAQRLFHKPKISHIHLDEMGSFIWLSIDGEKTVKEISLALEEEFGDRTKPLFERTSRYFGSLYEYGFIKWKRR